jgi:transcriptional regulator NrdR family protein
MALLRVQKSSGYTQLWDVRKLERSIAGALAHVGNAKPGLARTLTREVVASLKGKANEVLSVDTIRETVVHVLRHHGETKGAEAYEFTALHLPTQGPVTVQKRSGRTEAFHPMKLFKSLKKSFEHAGLNGGILAEAVSKQVILALPRESPVPVELIRRTAAKLLREHGFKQVEKMYLLHKYL